MLLKYVFFVSGNLSNKNLRIKTIKIEFLTKTFFFIITGTTENALGKLSVLEVNCPMNMNIYSPGSGHKLWQGEGVAESDGRL